MAQGVEKKSCLRKPAVTCQYPTLASTCNILRVSVKYQNYRYAKKTQISLAPKKYRYVGEITSHRTEKKSGP
jgi:hypothetical protein